MPLNILSGCAKQVKQALFDRVRIAHADGKTNIVMLVPAQMTLAAELELLGEGAPGSFSLSVMSPGRLHQWIFDQAGWPKGARIDELGRVMLVHAAAQKHKRELNWYRNAVGRKGFAEKALSQIEAFKQAGLDPDALLDRIENLSPGALKSKLSDLRLLYLAYEDALSGRFLDGEDEARAAIQRMPEATLVSDAMVFVYGFDILSQTLAETLISLAECAKSLTLALCFDDAGRDAELYIPVARALGRLKRLSEAKSVTLTFERAPAIEIASDDAIAHLSRELGSVPPERFPHKIKNIQLAAHPAGKSELVAALKTPQDEAEFAAALIRQLVMDRAWRWRDIALCVQSLDTVYEGALRRAFALYDVPLFLPSSRPAERHPAAQCLLSALRLLTHGWQTDDMADYIRTGYTSLSDDEADLFINHILKRGLRGNALKQELRGLSEENQALEDFRAAVAKPLLALEKATAKQKDTRLVLGEIFAFLEKLDMCAQIEAQQAPLIDIGMREWAMEGPQVWNRMLLALDQMHELLQDADLSLKDAGELLSRALLVSEVRPLPQSGDAVSCGSIDHMKSQQVKALLVLGLTSLPVSGDSGLLSEQELETLDSDVRFSSSLGPADRARMSLLGLKSALAFTGDYLFLSFPGSDAKGAAQRPGAIVSQISRVFDSRLHLQKEQVQRMDRMRLNARAAAEARIHARFKASPDDPLLISVHSALGEHAIGLTLAPPVPLPASLAERLLRPGGRISVSQLERYTECPFKHFAQYALRPERFEEFSLTPRDAGEFYHEAMERFLSNNKDDLSTFTPKQSMAQMDKVTEQILLERGATLIRDDVGSQLSGEELCQVARRAAATLVRHLEGSKFRPSGIEVAFGEGEPQITLAAGARLEGRIDRVDQFEQDGESYLRVIDYKTGGKELQLAQIYYGLQMQLLVYLAAALKKHGGKPAGAFYFKLSDKLIDIDSREVEVIEKKRADEQRMTGLMLMDESVASAMARDAKQVIKSGADGKLSEKDFAQLIKHTLSKANEAYSGMRAGKIDVKPYQLGSQSACQYCEHGALCQKELCVQENTLADLSNPEVLQAIFIEES